MGWFRTTFGTSCAAIALGILTFAGPVGAIPASEDALTLDLLTATINALEASDDIVYDAAVDALQASGVWVPAATGQALATRDLDGLVITWLALEADDEGLLRLATDTIAEERDAMLFAVPGDTESRGAIQQADLSNASVLQVIDRRGLNVPELVRTVMTVNPRRETGEIPPRPALFDEALREVAGLLAGPAVDGNDPTRATGEAEAPALDDIEVGTPLETESDGLTLLPILVGGVGILAVLMAILLLQRRRSDEQMADLAFTDGLTGLNNRRRFDTDVAIVSRNGHNPTAMLMIDVDHFKAFNDTHGHGGGDQALRHVGEAISSGLRHGDIAYRYGGEEFCVLLQNTTDGVAHAIAERLRRTIAEAVIDLGNGELVSVTASVGLATGSADSLEQLITSADRAMYSAKRAGRNQLALA